MSKIKVKWRTYDGYMGGDRPHVFAVDPSEFVGMTEEEAGELLHAHLEDAFREKVMREIEDEEATLSLIMAEAAKLKDAGEEPCPANCADKAPAGQYYQCPVCDAEWFPEEGESQ